MTTPPSLPYGKRETLSWIDTQLIETSWVMLIGLMLLFFGLVWIFAIIGLFAARHPVARQKAKTLFGICTGYAVLVGLLLFAVVQSEA